MSLPPSDAAAELAATGIAQASMAAVSVTHDQYGNTLPLGPAVWRPAAANQGPQPRAVDWRSVDSSGALSGPSQGGILIAPTAPMDFCQPVLFPVMPSEHMPPPWAVGPCPIGPANGSPFSQPSTVQDMSDYEMQPNNQGVPACWGAILKGDESGAGCGNLRSGRLHFKNHVRRMPLRASRRP
jgi:hypothetical protein